MMFLPNPFFSQSTTKNNAQVGQTYQTSWDQPYYLSSEDRSSQVSAGGSYPSSSNEDDEWLESFTSYVEDHLDDHGLGVPRLAEAFAMSESTLLRQTKRLLGLTPATYLRNTRMAKAYAILSGAKGISAKRVAFMVGYENYRSFTRTFKDQFGVLPSDLS